MLTRSPAAKNPLDRLTEAGLAWGEGTYARLAAPIGRIRLVTCNAFDSVGASAARMRTAWVNRSAAPFDTIGAQPDLTLPALDSLPAALRQ